MRYHVLRNAATIRKVAIVIGCLTCSYVFAALMNAAPVIQPAIKSAPRVIVVAPPEAVGEEPASDEVPADRPEADLDPTQHPTRRL